MTTEKGGRPQANLNWDEIDTLLISGCSGREIAGYIGVNPATIYDRCPIDKGIPFSQYSQQKYEKGESLLRHQQFKKALGKTDEGDNTMLVWLGKNRLNQRDRPPEEINNNITIKVIDARNNSTEEIPMPNLPECSVDGN